MFQDLSQPQKTEAPNFRMNRKALWCTEDLRHCPKKCKKYIQTLYKNIQNLQEAGLVTHDAIKVEAIWARPVVVPLAFPGWLLALSQHSQRLSQPALWCATCELHLALAKRDSRRWNHLLTCCSCGKLVLNDNRRKTYTTQGFSCQSMCVCVCTHTHITYIYIYIYTPWTHR